jgi:hypothetical protein
MNDPENPPEPYKGPKAILFTHVAITNDYAHTLRTNPNKQAKFRKDHEPFFRACFDCTNVGVVYIYVDLGLRGLEVVVSQEKTAFNISGDVQADAELVRGLLAQAIDNARRKSAFAGRDTIGLPDSQFVVIGINELAGLVNYLLDIDPVLIEPIAGPNGIFTYDSPKFVEAVIRLARGAEPTLARQPILRMDIDVEPNDRAINAILSTVQSEMKLLRKYYFFSGGYRGRTTPDPTNEHAVRAHWFSLAEDKMGYAAFLGDLGELGATQLTADIEWSSPLRPGGLIPRSAEGQSLADKRGAPSTDRRSPQVISGAGLVMSFACILELPPFLGIPHFVVWIDDHLKRRLHEQLGHIATSEFEELTTQFMQDRPPASKEWAFEVYFERLLRGCLMHALIVAPDNTPGPLTKLVELAVRGHILIDKPIRTEQERASRQEQSKLFDRTGEIDCTEKALTHEFLREARKHGEKVMKVWGASRDAYDDSLLADWVRTPVRKQKQADGTWLAVPLDLEVLYQSTAKDAYRYLLLVAEWWDYVRAIMRLTQATARWLFIRPI